MIRCECFDFQGCPVGHEGQCDNTATISLYRIDLVDDQVGTEFCAECADDAMTSGLFAYDPAEDQDLDWTE